MRTTVATILPSRRISHGRCLLALGVAGCSICSASLDTARLVQRSSALRCEPIEATPCSPVLSFEKLLISEVGLGLLPARERLHEPVPEQSLRHQPRLFHKL